MDRKDERNNREELASNIEQELGAVQYASMLYDFYGPLLNDNQKSVMALYHEDNYSLSEIAEELGTTRQAIHYTLKKAEHALAEYESKLELVAAYLRNQKLSEEICEILANSEIQDSDRRRVTTILNSIVE